MQTPFSGRHAVWTRVTAQELRSSGRNSSAACKAKPQEPRCPRARVRYVHHLRADAVRSGGLSRADLRSPAVVARYFRRYPEIYARLGWSKFESINRPRRHRGTERLGFTCRTGFAERLKELERDSACNADDETALQSILHLIERDGIARALDCIDRILWP